MGTAVKRIPPSQLLDRMADPEPSSAEVVAQAVRAVLTATGFSRLAANGFVRERMDTPPAGVVILFIGRARFAFSIPTASDLVEALGEAAEGKTLPARKRIADVQRVLLAAATDAVRAVDAKVLKGRGR